jgi:hypothetical protein
MSHFKITMEVPESTMLPTSKDEMLAGRQNIFDMFRRMKISCTEDYFEVLCKSDGVLNEQEKEAAAESYTEEMRLIDAMLDSLETEIVG